MPQELDLLTIGNAIVDIIARVEDGALGRLKVEKGAMTLVDTARALELYEAMGGATGGAIETPGGSAANTAAGLVSLGGRGAYVGKVSNDALGAVFAREMRAGGVHFETPPLEREPPTARSMILVTPDGERSMNTYLGACVELAPTDIVPAVVEAARVTYFEGYLWDPPLAKDAIVKAAGIAHAAGREVAMTLSDAFCVHRYRDEFLDLMRTGTVDIVFANEAEVLALYETSDLTDALRRFGAETRRLGVVTRSEKGCVVAEGGALTPYPATRVDPVADTTGAGDLFAAGFLRGYTAGLAHARSAALGAVAAGHIIAQLGPRPQRSLAELPEAAAILAAA